jgi:AraC family transcriptional regulator
MNRPPITAARFLDFLPSPPDASATWSVFSVHVMEPPVQATMAWSDHVLALQLSGTCRLRREMGGRSAEGWSGPGCVSLIPARVEGTWEGRGHSGISRAIALFVPEVFLSRVIAQDWDVEPRSVAIVDRFLARDPVIEGLLTRLAFEARNGSPSGSIYAESACEFLAHHIIHAHSSLAAPPPPSSGGLPARRLKQILEYVEENLGQPISLRQLADLAGLSARHFERAFRQALGVPPHAYVLQKRVAAARQLLLDQPTLAIQEIAVRVGFSSASHLASAFRRRTGHTPGAFRRLQSR